MRWRTNKKWGKKRILYHLTLHFLFAVILNITGADEEESLNCQKNFG
jgi:hypothetical protein